MMTVFLYPIFRKDSEELAMGMLLFRGALEGAWYFVSTIGIITIVALGNEYVVSGADSTALQSMGNVIYKLIGLIGPVGTIMFLSPDSLYKMAPSESRKWIYDFPKCFILGWTERNAKL